MISHAVVVSPELGFHMQREISQRECDFSRRVAAEHSGSIVARNLSSAGAEFLLTIPGVPMDVHADIPEDIPKESATELLSASM